MSLADNTEKIRALIEGISALPDVGNGGGGLPVGVSHLASGTFTPAYDICDGVEVVHGFGVKPNFYIVSIVDDLSETMLENAVIFIFVFAKNMLMSIEYPWNDYVEYWGLAQMDGSSWDTWGSIDNENDDYGLADTTVTFKGMYNMGLDITFPFKAGHTYRWICGVIDGIN